MTFLLTVCIGGLLTNRYQAAQWRKEQQYGIWKQSIADRRLLSERVISSVTANISATSDVITLYDWEFRGPFKRREQVNARLSNWAQQSGRWDVDAEVIAQQLVDLYKDGDIHDLFEVIRRDSVDLNVHVTNLLASSDSQAITKKNTRAVAEYRDAVLVTKQIKADLRRLTSLMSKEIGRENQVNPLTDATSRGFVEQIRDAIFFQSR
jgi:hypothetical protein